MTILIDTPRSASSDVSGEPTEGVEWMFTDVVQPPAWIGRYRKVYVGMIEERDTEGFVSITHRGRNLGRFDTLEDAQKAFIKN